MIDDRDGAPRWEAYSHEEILAMVRAGPGPAASQHAAGRWDGTWAAVSAIEADLARAVAEAGGGWAGLAADAMTAGATPLGQWAGEAAAQAKATAQAVDAQARYAEYTRREMPPLAHPGVPAEPYRGTQPVISRVPIMTDWATVEGDRDAAAARARDLMATYGRNSYDTLPGMLDSHGPPSVVVQNTATGTLHGPGTSVAALPGGPAITADNTSAGTGTAAAGASVVGAAAGPAYRPGTGATGPVPGLGAAAGARSSGSGPPRGGGVPGSGGMASARPAPAGLPAAGAGPGGYAGGAGAGATSSDLSGRTAGGPSGQGGVGPDGREPVGPGVAGSRGRSGTVLAGGGAGIGPPSFSPRAPLLPGEPPAGPGWRGTTGPGPVLDGALHRSSPGAGPVLDPWTEGRPGGVAGRVATSPLPPPVVLDRGSPERPFPSSAPVAGRALGEGFIPLGAGAMGHAGSGEHRRPHYLVDDGSAFADDRPIPGPVINEGWPRD